MNSNWDTEYYAAQPPFTVSEMHSWIYKRLSHRLVHFTHGTLFTESSRFISIDPTFLIIDGWIPDDNVAGITVFYIICYLASQWVVMNHLCETEWQNGWCQLKLRLNCECEEALRCIFFQKNKYISLAYLMDWNYFGTLVYITDGWLFSCSLNANLEDTQASTFVAVLCYLCSRTCPVVEGSASVLWGVRPAAGEGACAGPAEGGRVSVCPQGDARQDPGYGKGILSQTRCLNLSPDNNIIVWPSYSIAPPFAKFLKHIILKHLPQRNTSLPDDTNVARLQEELIGVKLREAEALTGLKELRQQVRDLEEHWQVGTNGSVHYLWHFFSKCENASLWNRKGKREKF